MVEFAFGFVYKFSCEEEELALTGFFDFDEVDMHLV